MANAGQRDEEKIKDGIRRADFVRKGKNMTEKIVKTTRILSIG